MITPDHIEQELSRLERCERFNDPTRRNWPWKEVWQEAMERHRAFLKGESVPLPLIEETNEAEGNINVNRIAVAQLKKGFKYE